MKRMTVRTNRLAMGLALAALSLGAVALAGCTNPAKAEKSDNPKVWGYVTTAKQASLDIRPDQLGTNELVVDKVVAPQDAWVVVHADDNGKPGARVGLAHVKRGESVDFSVKLKKLTTPKVIVALHADRATKNKFDFDMMAKEMSPDRPYFVDEKEVATVVTVREFGVKTTAGTAAVAASMEPGQRAVLTVDSVVAPTDAWVVVHTSVDGAPAARVGLAHVTAGTTSGLQVKLDPVPLTSELLVAVHADRGTPGLYEFDMMDKINSPDQPFFVDGKEVAVPVAVQ